MIRTSNDGSGSNPAETVFRSLLRVFGLLRQIMEPHFARFGISGSQWAILRVLHRAEENGETGLGLGEVGTRLLIRPPSVTGVVDRLERQGLVQRSDSERDRRARQVSLTSAGRQLVDRVLVVHADQIKSLFGGLRPPELESLRSLLKQWETYLGVLVLGQSKAKVHQRKVVKAKTPL